MRVYSQLISGVVLFNETAASETYTARGIAANRRAEIFVEF